jgi:hypothetical protein
MSTCMPLLTSPVIPPVWLEMTTRASDAGLRAVRLPFDAARAQYATAVQTGFIERSLLASCRFDRSVDRLERFALGPWARRV